MSYHNGPRIVTDGLVLYLDAGNSKSYPGSGMAWNDLSGNSNNATLVNGPIYSIANKGSIVFDGVNDYGIVSAWNGFTGNAIFTYDLFFMKLNNNNSNYISYGTANLSQMNQFGVFNNGIGALNYANDTVVSVSQIANNQWYHATVSHNGSTTILYFNGIVYNTKNTSYNFGSSSLYIGQAAIGGFYANIRLAQLKFYNRSLSSREVLQNYNALKCRYNL